MDESTPAEISEDTMGNKPNEGQTSCGKDADPSTGDTPNRVFCCRDCGEAFREEAAYLEHCSQHPQDNLYSDNQLDSGEKDRGTPYFCTMCSLSFVELSDFDLHMRSHEKIPQEDSGRSVNSGTVKQQTYECPDCGKCYGVLGYFLNHRRSHRPPSKSVFHDLEHLKKKSFQCESCGRNYSRASALDAHRRCHEEKLVKSKHRSPGDTSQMSEAVVEGKPSENQAENYSESPFKCACGKAFSALYRLKTHQRFSRNSQCSPEELNKKTKKGFSEFSCEECKKVFNGQIALFNHQRWHANQSDRASQKFPCEECGKVFMTLTFYYRHQRTAHSEETPSKSFLHQVCQLQKKSFECTDCGLKFSRASALHSHQLHHTDAFGETEKGGQTCADPSVQEKMPESGRSEMGHLQTPPEADVEQQSLCPASTAEESHMNESEDDMGSYEPGDFNVQVISASESEGEEVEDMTSDLELVCESDQELRDDADASFQNFLNKPELDLKIVQIDLEQVDELGVSTTRDVKNRERFECPECHRWFSSSSSLRMHRTWHGVRKKRHQIEGQSEEIYSCSTCGHQTSSFEEHCNHIQTHSDPSLDTDEFLQAEGLERKNLTCVECGETFTQFSALVAHQLEHPKRKPFQCPDCMVSYSHASNLFNHMKTCSVQTRKSPSDTKKEYNPNKTLLGPKVYHCEQCGKGFWSLGAYSHHKQSQTECADLRLRKGFTGSLHSVNGHARSLMKVACPVCGRKFRHKGIMALHMRKHENGNHKCELCDRSFRLFSSLLRHQVVHSDQLLPPPIKSFQHQVEQLQKNTYSCPDCGKLFSRAKALQFHLKSHGYETGHAPSSQGSTVKLEDLQCASCFAYFNNKVSLRAHMKLCVVRDGQGVRKTESSPNVDNVKMHSDNIDMRNQGSSDPLKIQTEVKNEVDSGEVKIDNDSLDDQTARKQKYRCQKCEKSFSVLRALNFHRRIHDDDNDSAARVDLEASALLRVHKQERHKKGSFDCSDCGRRFSTNAALGSHRRWHTEKKCSLSSTHHNVLNPEEDAQPQSNQIEQISSSGRVQASPPSARCKSEQSDSLEAADQQGDERLQHNPEHPDQNHNRTEASSTTSRTHKCPICSLTFAKARGLRAHDWQVHSKSTKGRKKILLIAEVEESASNNEQVNQKEDSSAVETVAVTINSSPVGKERPKTESPGKSITCLDCGKLYSCAGELLDHKKVCSEVKSDSKLETRPVEAISESSPPLSHVSEHTAKCFFKCNKCGKAFQTEEQLGTHKLKSKSRPYCCALCCHGFWTETQLQQHLAWHDEVRCRLPNEVRYRLSAALTPKPPKAHGIGKPLPSSPAKRASPDPAGQSQNSHKCQHCGKAFLSPAALQRHETEQCDHNNSFHCSFCPGTFRGIQELIDHHQDCMRNYERRSEAAVSSGEPEDLACLECGTTFFKESDLHQHYIEHARGY
ncbi:zinc finger protein 91 isoform X2 [Salarias fasciatus]|uniref:zinc finger protein 91 isoform X2 n=1 Tax=Salarias fasciatus TaxID=181472 RepID=UPI001176A6E9|nr:zinc finger protein 91-like isoform X2 [Salarias fasciatus]